MRFVREVLGLAGLVFLLGMVWLSWPGLPSRVPTHFGITGRADGFGDKSTLFYLPAAGIGLYTLLTVLSFFPQAFNYPVPVTRENRPRLHRLGVSLAAWLKAEVLWIFAYLCSGTIQVAEGRSTGLDPAFLPISLIIVGGTVGFHVIGMRRRETD